MTAHGTLAEARAELENRELHFRASDFLSDEEQQELHEASRMESPAQKPYDEVDAFAAELLARFGWETYQAWHNGEFDHQRALRFIAAERAREIRNQIPLESMMLLTMAGANHFGKNGKPPKSLAHAQKLLKEQIKKG